VSGEAQRPGGGGQGEPRDRGHGGQGSWGHAGAQCEEGARQPPGGERRPSPCRPCVRRWSAGQAALAPEDRTGLGRRALAPGRSHAPPCRTDRGRVATTLLWPREGSDGRGSPLGRPRARRRGAEQIATAAEWGRPERRRIRAGDGRGRVGWRLRRPDLSKTRLSKKALEVEIFTATVHRKWDEYRWLIYHLTVEVVFTDVDRLPLRRGNEYSSYFW